MCAPEVFEGVLTIEEVFRSALFRKFLSSDRFRDVPWPMYEVGLSASSRAAPRTASLPSAAAADGCGLRPRDVGQATGTARGVLCFYFGLNLALCALLTGTPL